MSERTEQLKAKWEDLEAKAIEVQNQKDEAIEKVRERFAQKQVDAVNAAAAAQKEFLDREVAESLLDRPDGADVAKALVASGGLMLPDDVADALGIEI